MDLFSIVLGLILASGGTGLLTLLNQRHRDNLNAQVLIERERTIREVAALHGMDAVQRLPELEQSEMDSSEDDDDDE